MYAIEQWAQKRDPLVQIIAFFLIPLAKTFYEVLLPVKQGDTNQGIPAITPDDVYLYQTPPHDLLRKVALSITSISSLGKQIGNIALSFLDQKDPEDSIYNICLSDKEWAQLLLNDLKEEIASKGYGGYDERQLQSAVLIPEFSFFLRVVLPCYYFYKEDYWRLFEKAREGDVKALSCLLKLDKSLVQYSQINKWIYHYSTFENKWNFDQVVNALGSYPSGKVTRQNIKYKLAGAVSSVLEILGKSLTEPDIRSLFNAISIDYGENEQIDTDLPDSQEAFSKAIQREKKTWRDLYQRIILANKSNK